MSNLARHQKGASIWMVLLVVVILGFGAIFGLKLIPVYLENWKIENAIKNALQSGVESANKAGIKNAIIRRLDIDDVRRITSANFSDYMTITKNGPRVRVDLDYEARESLFGNVSVVAHFTKTFDN